MKQFILKSLQKILAICARIYLLRTKPKVIGITGSVGKTSCRMIVSGVLKKYLPKQRIETSDKNFNSELGLVFSVFQISNYSPSIPSLLGVSIKIFLASLFRGKKYDIIVLEYGVDHPGDMDFLLNICQPDYSIFTKLDKIHSVYFDTPNGIGDEKIKLLQNAQKKSFLNPLDNFCKEIFDTLPGKKEYFSKITGYKLEQTGKTIGSSFIYNKNQFSTNLIGKENIDYIGLAFQILQEFGTEPQKDDFIQLNLQGGRMSIFQGIQESILIDSTYNAGPESMRKMIENTFSIRGDLFSDRKVILVLGEMRELGNDIVGVEHRKLFEYSKKASAIFMVGQEVQYLEEELHKNNYKGFFKTYKKSRDAGKELAQYLESSDQKYIILFKGSQNTIFTEEALKEVLLNKVDKKKLVRQSDDWMRKKEKFFAS